MESIRSYPAITIKHAMSTVDGLLLRYPPEAKKFCGRKRITLPVLLDNDITEAAKCHQQLQISQFKTREHRNTLRHLANDRNGWKNLTNSIYSVTQGEQ